jgi:hypothetical protein
MPRAKKSSVALLSATVGERDQRIKKSVGAIHTSGELTLVQKKMSNIFLFNAYDDLLTKRTHQMPVPILCAMLGWDVSRDIDLLRDALSALASTAIEFNLTKEGKEHWQVMSLISFGEIRGGVCSWRYDEELARRLHDPETYAMINLRVQRKFSAGHALNLYENCLRYKDVNSTGWWSVDFFRQLVGAKDAYYDDFRRLSDRVIKPSIKQINDVSDIEIRPETRRENRRIVEIRFDVREKSSAEQTKLQQALPGLSFKESLDEYEELRKSKVYGNLRDHGISDRLALAWLRDEGEERVGELVIYTEAQDREKKIKGSTGGYLRSLIENEADVGKSSHAKKKDEEAAERQRTIDELATAAKDQDAREGFKRHETIKALKALTREERLRHVEAYQHEAGQGRMTTWNPETATFASPVERAYFDGWLRLKVRPPFDETAFKAWQAQGCGAGKGAPKKPADVSSAA